VQMLSLALALFLMLNLGAGMWRVLRGQPPLIACRPRSYSALPRVGNDAIQPLEKSASNPLFCNERNFAACGLQIFDARRGERRRGRRE